MEYSYGLLEKHFRDPALVDSNLLLLYLVGRCDPRIIPRFQRTKKYTIEDFEILGKILGRGIGRIVTTPNVLTEVSNLATKLGDEERKSFFDTMTEMVGTLDETYCPSSTAVQDQQFRKFGLTDAAILTISSQGMLVLTDDLPLYLALSHRGVDVINFTHLRQEAGTLG